MNLTHLRVLTSAGVAICLRKQAFTHLLLTLGRCGYARSSEPRVLTSPQDKEIKFA